ncbi:hypothetical protein C0991_005181, partial [Blastosporella zonata]
MSVRARIAFLPSNSFERNMLEEDENFYNTFPQSRQAAMYRWIALHFPHAPWAQPFLYHGTQISVDYDYPAPPFKPVSIHAAIPPMDFSTFTLGNALTFSPPPSAKSAKPLTSNLHYDGIDTFKLENRARDQHRYTKGFPASVFSPPSPELERTQLVYEIRHPKPASRPLSTAHTVHRSMPSLPPSSLPPPKLAHHRLATPLATGRKTTTPAPRSKSPGPIVPPSCSFRLPQYTGNWEADAIAAHEYLHNADQGHVEIVNNATISIPATPNRPVMNAPPTRRHHLTHGKLGRPSSRSRPRPYLPSSRPRSNSGDKSTTPPPPRKRPTTQLRDKHGKPLMACFFCRGRKIACGPPPMGSDDHTC